MVFGQRHLYDFLHAMQPAWLHAFIILRKMHLNWQHLLFVCVVCVFVHIAQFNYDKMLPLGIRFSFWSMFKGVVNSIRWIAGDQTLMWYSTQLFCPLATENSSFYHSTKWLMEMKCVCMCPCKINEYAMHVTNYLVLWNYMQLVSKTMHFCIWIWVWVWKCYCCLYSILGSNTHFTNRIHILIHICINTFQIIVHFDESYAC